MRYIAHFQAEAWQNDYANPVDPEGPEEWDCTEHLTKRKVVQSVDACLLVAEDWEDSFDILKGDPAAPEWIREWRGPFTITVRRGATPTTVEPNSLPPAGAR